jgi:transposase-like protein
MEMTLKKFRGEVLRQREGRQRGAGRYREELREFAVAHARAAKASGGSVCSAALELGISDVTLGSWLQKSSASGKVRRVEVTPPCEREAPRSTTGLRVTTIGGHVVSGLTVEQAAQLLRALS